MEQRFSLEAAGKLMGVSANAMRARAKKNPDQYRIERDNRDKIWLWIDPEKFPILKPSKVELKGSENNELKASIVGLISKIEAASNQTELQNRIKELEDLLLEKQGYISEQEILLAEIQERSKGKDKLLAEKDARLSEKDDLIAEIKADRDQWRDQAKKSNDLSHSERWWWQRLFGKSM